MSDTDTKDTDGTDKDADDTVTPPEKDVAAEAEKWKALARKHEAQAKANAEAARKLAELEEADKTELQRATDRIAAAEKRATDAETKLSRLEVALDSAPEGMALPKVRKLAGRLSGGSREELEADAAELFSEFVSDTADNDETDESDTDTDAARRRPTERLRPGAVTDAEPEVTDPAKLAASVPRGVW